MRLGGRGGGGVGIRNQIDIFSTTFWVSENYTEATVNVVFFFHFSVGKWLITLHCWLSSLFLRNVNNRRCSVQRLFGCTCRVLSKLEYFAISKNTFERTDFADQRMWVTGHSVNMMRLSQQCHEERTLPEHYWKRKVTRKMGTFLRRDCNFHHYDV